MWRQDVASVRPLALWLWIPALFLLFWPTEVRGVPHTIRAVEHPFDPDWLDIKLLLLNKCVGCHRAGSGRTDLTTYDAVIAARAEGEPVIKPGDPDGSLFYEYVVWNVNAVVNSDEPDEPMMPEERSEWLTAGQLAAVRRWIANGALEYRLPNNCNIRPLLESDYPSAKQCAVCHPRQYAQWSASMHHYAQHSPIFEAFNRTLLERTSGTLGTFCSRCHTPIGTSLGEEGQRSNVARSRLSMEGVTCIVCHRQDRPQYKDNGRIDVQPGDLKEGCVYGPFADSVSTAVGSHPSAERPYLLRSQFCGNCHDVTNPAGLRLEEAFSEWQNSPAAKAGIRCHDCHMGPVPGVPIPPHQRPLGRAAEIPGIPPERFPLRRLSDHSFVGPDYSLLPDSEFPHKLDWMYEQDYRNVARLTPHQRGTLTELRRRNRELLNEYGQKRVALLRNGAKLHVRHSPTARLGDVFRVETDVQSVFGGHSYPSGFSAERQLWIWIEVRNPAGQLVFVSGDLDSNGDLRDEHSHEVLTGQLSADRHLVNFQNKFTALTNKGTERTVVVSVNRHLSPLNIVRPAPGIAASVGRPPAFRIAKGSIAPLRTRSKSYPVPTGVYPGPYRVHVRLNFRHLPPTLLDHVGAPHLKHLLQIVTIDEYCGIVDVR